jgi:hypothetical protein
MNSPMMSTEAVRCTSEPFSGIRMSMSMVQATLWIYATALRRSWESLLKNWVVSFAPWVYAALLSIVALVVAPLGIIGGLIVGLATQACISSGLYLIKNIVESRRTDLKDFVNGFTVYLWELLGIAFILWIPMRILAMALASTPNGGLVFALIQVAVFILLNPAPELIYQTRSSGLGLLRDSYNFVVENWLEWLLPNIVVTVTGYLILNILSAITIGLPSMMQIFIIAAGMGLCLSYFMIFRGFLFAELYGSTRRSRAYRYKAQG